jgi:hypothetical protein
MAWLLFGFERINRMRIASLTDLFSVVKVFTRFGISEQMALPGSRTNPELVAARFLLKPGHKYEDAVKTFQPYDKIQEVNEDARNAGAGMIVEGERYEPRRKTYIYVNNRLEGNALETISAMLEHSVVMGRD